MSIRRSLTLLALPFLLLAACRGTSSYQVVPMPAQDVEVSRPDRARIYVLRAGQARGLLRSVRVEEGDLKVGALGPSEYLCWERSPGRVLLTFVHEAPKIDGGDVEGLYALEAAAGKAYYLLVHLDRTADDPELTEAGHPRIEVLGEAEGRQLVSERRPVPVR